MSEIKGLAHVGIFTRDIAQSKTFYTDVLGFSIDNIGALDREPFSPMCTLSKNGCIVQLIENGDKAAKNSGVHVAFLVDSVLQHSKLLADKGVTFLSDEILFNDTIYDNGFNYLLFSGPSGELLEIHEIIK